MWNIRLKALILILLGAFFAQKYISNSLGNYLNENLWWLALAGAVMFFMLAVSNDLVGDETPTHDHHHDHDGHDDHDHHHHDHHGHDHHHHAQKGWQQLITIGIVALPILFGVMVPHKSLGADTISKRGIALDPQENNFFTNNSYTVTNLASQRTILDWVVAIEQDYAQVYGQEANIVGFVYRDSRFADNQFMAIRFVMTCCVADAMPIGIVIQGDTASDFELDQWVRIKGVFESQQVDGREIPVVVAQSIEPVAEPSQPYLFQ